MSLTTGRGPLGPDPAGHFDAPVPAGLVYVEPFPRRVRAVKAGRRVVETDSAWLVHRTGSPPTFAFPASDVQIDASEPEPAVPGHVRLPWDAADEWYEELERMLGHPRNPYHRVDCLRTDRRLVVRVASEVLVDTTETIGVYETSLAPRLYVSPDQVRRDLLTPSETTTFCPYKGTATHWTAVVGATSVPDVAWSYEEPLPECEPLRGLLSFYRERAEVVEDFPPGR